MHNEIRVGKLSSSVTVTSQHIREAGEMSKRNPQMKVISVSSPDLEPGRVDTQEEIVQRLSVNSFTYQQQADISELADRVYQKETELDLASDKGEIAREIEAWLGDKKSDRILAAPSTLAARTTARSLGATLLDPVDYIKVGTTGAIDPRTFSLIEERARLGLNFVVIPGGVGGDHDSRAQIIPKEKGGSDVTAICWGLGIGAGRVDIFTDIGGVYSASPNVVPSAKQIGTMNHRELSEIGLVRNQIMEPAALEMVSGADEPLPIWIGDFSQREDRSTLITKDRVVSASEDVIAIVREGPLRALSVEKQGLVSEAGVAEQMFAALATLHIPVVRSSSSDDSFVVFFREEHILRPEQRGQLFELLQSFSDERARPRLLEEQFGCVSVVGEGVENRPFKVGARFFSAIDEANLKIHKGVACSMSGITVSVIVDYQEVPEAVRAAYNKFIR